MSERGPLIRLKFPDQKIKRVGHGFTNFDDCRLRLLLHCGATWQDQSAPKAQRTHSALGGVEPIIFRPLNEPDELGRIRLSAHTSATSALCRWLLDKYAGRPSRLFRLRSARGMIRYPRTLGRNDEAGEAERRYRYDGNPISTPPVDIGLTPLKWTRMQLSTLDEHRFGVRTAKAHVSNSESITGLLTECRRQNVQLLIVRCATRQMDVVHTMEKAGFLLMDTLIVMVHDLSNVRMSSASHARDVDLIIRPAGADDAHTVSQLARLAFHGYNSHYHADERLDTGAADEVYASWAYRSCCHPDVADEVLLAEAGGVVLGFTVMKTGVDGHAEGVLDAVHPGARGRGIYRALSMARLKWAIAAGATDLTVSTQVTNIPAQRGLSTMGFLPDRSFYTFHKWLY